MKIYLYQDGDRIIDLVENREYDILAQERSDFGALVDKQDREIGDLISLLASEKSTRNHLIKRGAELERELNASKAENEAMRSAVNDADLALRKCLNHLLMQPAFARNRSDIEREAETMESVHVALGKLQPFLK